MVGLAVNDRIIAASGQPNFWPVPRHLFTPSPCTDDKRDICTPEGALFLPSCRRQHGTIGPINRTGQLCPPVGHAFA
jgi:hypothetical protein